MANLGGFAVKDFGQEEPKKSGRDRVKRSNWYLLDTYTVGPYVIPPQLVAFTLPGGRKAMLKSPEIFVEVKSVMEEGSGEEGLRDIKSPLNVPTNVPTWLIVVSGSVILAFNFTSPDSSSILSGNTSNSLGPFDMDNI